MAILMLAMPLMWQSCAEEDFQTVQVGEEFQGVSLQIPYVAPGAELPESTRSALTRAGQPADFNAEEAKINELYVFAFPSGVSGVKVAKKLSSTEYNGLDDAIEEGKKTGYKKLDLKLEIGEYHLYLVANVTLDKFEEMTEDQVANYNFAALCGPLSTFSNGLPMSCGADEISCNNKTNDNYVKVELNKSVDVKANLKFAVSKVRVSVVNNADDAFKLSKFTVTEIADKLNLFSSVKSDPTVTAQTKELMDNGAFYGLTTLDESTNKYDVDNLGAAIATPTAKGWIWQVTFYVPERKTLNKTAVTLDLGSKTPSFALGQRTGNDCNLNRSEYYRYYFEPSSGEATLQVAPWTMATVAATLGGPVTLEVDKTDMGNISGSNPGKIYYNSNLDDVTYESPMFGTLGKVYILKQGSDEGGDYFTVTVNPALGIQTLTEEQKQQYGYFYIIAGPIKKKITAEPDLGAFLIVTPESYTVVMKEIANVETYSVDFTYSTNLNTLKYAWGSDNNDNTKNGELTYLMTQADATTGSEVSPGSSTNLGQNGRITVRFNAPYDPSKFQDESSLKFVWTASQTGVKSLEANTELNIVPNRNGYRLWFRDDADVWDDVHVYVYQPLQYGKKKEDGSIELVDVKCYYDNNTKSAEDALLYSITGKKQFMGWDVLNISPSEVTYDGVKYWEYKDLRVMNYDAENRVDDYDRKTKYYQTDFMSEWRSKVTCNTCKGENYHRLWPGIQMKKIEDPASAQYNWWYIDLPAICQPGKTMIMFTRGHKGATDDFDHRNPMHMVPGYPLYDYPDREGWFYHRPSKGHNNEFVDDQPKVVPVEHDYSYTLSGTFNSWSENKDTDKFTEQSDGTWKITKTISDETEFGIRRFEDSNKAWIYGTTGSVITYNSNMPCVVANNNGDNWKKLPSGTYTFIFNPRAMTLRIDGGNAPNTTAYNVNWKWSDNNWEQKAMTWNGNAYAVTFKIDDNDGHNFEIMEGSTYYKSTWDNTTVQLDKDMSGATSGKAWWLNSGSGTYTIYWYKDSKNCKVVKY